MSFDLGELSISLNLNTGSFQRDLDNAERRVEMFGKRRLTILLELEDNGSKALSDFENNIVKTQRWLNRNRLTVRAGHEELTELNKHIEAKKAHVKDVQRWLNNNPLSVRTRDSGQSEASVKSVKQEVHHSVAVSAKDNADKISKDLGKELKAIANILKSSRKNPLQKIMGVGGVIGSSFLTGFFTSATKGIGKSFEQGLDESLSDIIGSLNLYSRELGKAAGKVGKDLISQGEKAVRTVVQGGTPEQIIREKAVQMQRKSSTPIDFDDPQVAEELARQTVDEINRNLKGYLEALRKVLPSKETLEKERFIAKGKIAVADKKNERYIDPGMDRDFLDAKKSQSQNDKIFSDSKQKIEKIDRVGLKLIEKRNKAIEEQTRLELSIKASRQKIKQAETDKIEGTPVDPFYDEKGEFDNIRSQQARIKELEAKQESLAKKINDLSDAKTKIAARGTKAGAAIADGKNKADRLSRQYSEKNYEREVIESILKELGVTNYDRNNLPKIRSSEGTKFERKSAGAYIAESNEVLLEKQRYQAFKDRKLDSGSGILGKMTIAHEVSHYVQLGSGLKGVSRTDDIRKGIDPRFEEVTPKTGEVSSKEFTESFGKIKTSVAEMVAGYLEYQREFEADAEMAARRVGKRAILKQTVNSTDSDGGIANLKTLKQEFNRLIAENIKQDLMAVAQDRGVVDEIDLSGLNQLQSLVNAQIDKTLDSADKVLNIDDAASFKDIDKFKSVASGDYQAKLESTIEELITAKIAEAKDAISVAENKKNSIKAKIENSAVAVANSGLSKSDRIENLSQLDLAKTAQIAARATGNLAKASAQGVLDLTKFTYGVAKAGENLAFGFIPGARQMKNVTQVGVPLLGGAAVASQIPGLLPAMGGAIELASSASQGLLSPLIGAGAGAIGEAAGSGLAALPFGMGGVAGGAVEAMALGAGNAVAGALPAIAGVGMAAKATSTAIENVKTKIEQVTGTNSKAIAAGENLANNLFRLGGQVKSFSETLSVQKQKASMLRQQLPSAKDIKALPPTERVQKATTMARIAAQGMADQRVLINSIPKEQRTQGGQIGQARSLLGEFSKQLNKAKRVLAKEKIDIDDVVNMKNITAQVEVVGSDIAKGIGIGAKKNKAPQQAMETVAVEILESFDKKIERRSPPKKFILRGSEIGDALAIGIRKNAENPKKALSDLAKELDNKVGQQAKRIASFKKIEVEERPRATANSRAARMDTSEVDNRYLAGASKVNKLKELDKIIKQKSIDVTALSEAMASLDKKYRKLVSLSGSSNKNESSLAKDFAEQNRNKFKQLKEELSKSIKLLDRSRKEIAELKSTDPEIMGGFSFAGLRDEYKSYKKTAKPSSDKSRSRQYQKEEVKAKTAARQAKEKIENFGKMPNNTGVPSQKVKNPSSSPKEKFSMDRVTELSEDFKRRVAKAKDTANKVLGDVKKTLDDIDKQKQAMEQKFSVPSQKVKNPSSSPKEKFSMDRVTELSEDFKRRVAKAKDTANKINKVLGDVKKTLDDIDKQKQAMEQKFSVPSQKVKNPSSSPKEKFSMDRVTELSEDFKRRVAKAKDTANKVLGDVKKTLDDIAKKKQGIEQKFSSKSGNKFDLKFDFDNFLNKLNSFFRKKINKPDTSAFRKQIEDLEREIQSETGNIRLEFTGDPQIDKVISRAQKNANKYDSAAERIMSDDDESKTVDRLNNIKKAFKTLWESDEFGGLKSLLGRRAKLAFDIVKDIGAKAALKFGALALAGVLAFKGITSAISGAVRAVGDLFLNIQRNIEAFKNLYSLQLKFKSAGLGRTGGFDLAQQQGISLEAVQGQAGITSSLKSQLGTKKAAEIAAKLSQGLVNKGIQGEDLTGSLTAFSQIGSKGKFQAEESMQLRERLPDIAQLSESALGVSAAQMEDMQRSGKILAVEYLPAIADELERAGGSAELPTKELQKALNNSEKLRASLGEGTLDATRPILKIFNAIANQGTLVSGLLKGLGIGFVALAGYGVVSLGKIAMGFGIVSTSVKGALGAVLKFSYTTLPLLAGVAAGLALIGTTWTAIGKKSEATIALEEMADAAGKLADSLERAGKVKIKPPQGDRFGAKTDGNWFQNLFSGDVGSRFVDFVSSTSDVRDFGTDKWKGGLTRMKEADEDIATADFIQNSTRTYTQSMQSPEELQKIVDDIQGQKARLAAKKVELIDLTNAKAGRDEIQKVNREIGDLSGAISSSQKQISSFIQEYDNIKAFMETDQFANLSEENKAAIQQLFEQYGGQIDLFRGLQEQMAQKTKFELQFNLAQASIEAAKMDLAKGLAEIDLKFLERSQTSDINVALSSKQERRAQLQTELGKTESSVNTQRKELSAIPEDLKASIKALIGTNLEDATTEQIMQALTKLENSAEGAGEDLKAALTKAKELKQNEIDVLNKRKEILALELQIQADTIKRQSSVSQIAAVEPLAGVKASAINQEIELANSRIAKRLNSTAVSIAQTKIQFDKATGELAIVNNRLEALKNDFGGFDAATQQWFLNIIGKPTANFAEAINSVTPEMLQEVRNGFGEEISANPVREALVGQMEKLAQFSEQRGQLQLTQAQNRVSMVESASDQLFQALQNLETELSNSDNALRTQTRSLQDFVRSIEDYNFGLKDAVFNLQRQIQEVQRNIALTQIGGNNAFFSAAGIQNQITEVFTRIGSLVEEGAQIVSSDRRPELKKDKERDGREFKRRNQQIERQEEDIKVSTNSQVFQSQQAIARLQREKFSITDEDGAINNDGVKRLESTMRARINEANFSATSFNDYAARSNSPYRMTDLVFDEPNFSDFMDDPEGMLEAYEVVNQRLIELYQDRNRKLLQIEADGLKKAGGLRQKSTELYKEQEAEKTRAIEEEGRLQAAKTEKLAKTIQGTYLALNRSLKFGVPSIKLESDRLSLGNQDLYSSMFGTRDNQPYLTGRKKAEIQVGERQLQLGQQKSSLKDFLDNAGKFTSSADLIKQIGSIEGFDPSLKGEIVSMLSNAQTQGQIKEIIEAYRKQLGTVGEQLEELNANKDETIERAGKIAGQKDYLEVRSQKSEVRSQLGGVLKESGKLDVFETAKLDRSLGEEQINLDFDKQVDSIERLKGPLGEITDKYRDMYKAYEELRDIKLDNLIEQTDVLGSTLKDSVGAGFDSFIGTLKSDFGDMDKLWRNTLASMLEVFANFAAQMAKQELLKWIAGAVVGSSGGKVASAHEGGMVKENPTIPNFARGGLLGAIGEAYSKEKAAGNQPVLLVAGVGERILNKQQTQEWNAWAASGVKQNQAVPNMATGGMVGRRINSAVRNYNNTSSSNDYSSNDTINISLSHSAPTDPLNRSAERQASLISERVKRAKQRNG